MSESRNERRFKFDAPEGRAGWRGVDVVVFALACAVYVGARLWRLDGACLWFDEIFGVHAGVWHGWAGMWRFAALDLIHPPLFYAVLKVWAGASGAESVWWLRLLPVALSVAAVVPLVLLARELGLCARATNLALLLAAVSGTLIKYAQELRMYSLLLLAAGCSLWLFARLCNAGDARERARARDGDVARGVEGDDDARSDLSAAARGGGVRGAAVALFAANLALVYTHYFGWLLVALEALFVALFVRERLKAFALSVVAVALCFAPWAWAVWEASRAASGGLEQNLGWAERPRASELAAPYLALHEPLRAQRQSNEPLVLWIDAVLALVVFAPPLAALCWRAFVSSGRARLEGAGDDSRGEGIGSRGGGDSRGGGERRAASERRAVAFLIYFSFAPVAAAFVLAQALPQSVWGVRHVIVVAPAYLLFVASAFVGVRAAWASILLRVALGCWLALAGVVALTRRDPPPVWCAWDALALAAARDDAATDARDELKTGTRGDATRGGTRVEEATPRVLTIYAFEDLVGYQMWHALRAAGEGRLRVGVVRGVPGVADDRAFFLPRGFDEVSVETLDDMTRDREFWIALRGARWDADAPPVSLLRARGYEVEPRHEFDAGPQRAFVALARRR